MTPSEQKALAEQITTNPLFNKILDGMEENAIEALIYAVDDDTRRSRAQTVQAIRTFRSDLAQALNTREPKAAPA